MQICMLYSHPHAQILDIDVTSLLLLPKMLNFLQIYYFERKSPILTRTSPQSFPDLSQRLLSDQSITFSFIMERNMII